VVSGVLGQAHFKINLLCTSYSPVRVHRIDTLTKLKISYILWPIRWQLWERTPKSLRILQFSWKWWTYAALSGTLSEIQSVVNLLKKKSDSFTYQLPFQVTNVDCAENKHILSSDHDYYKVNQSVASLQLTSSLLTRANQDSHWLM
jgi:hypothetical protein